MLLNEVPVELASSHYPASIADGEPLLIRTGLNIDGAGRPVEFAVDLMVARLSGPITYRLRTSA